MRRIKILHLVSTFAVKTDTKWLVRLTRQMDRAGFEIAVGAFYDDGPIKQQFTDLGVATFNLNCPRIWDLRAIVRLVAKIREFNPDIIHTHLLRADILGGLAGRLTDRRVVSTVYAYGDYRRMYRRPWADNLLDQISTRCANRFIGVCEAIRDDLVNRVGVDAKRVEVIHTGIDPIDIDLAAVEQWRQDLKINANEKVVLVAARLSYEKGVDCFLRAVRLLVDRGTQARFLIAGSGPLEHELKQSAQTLGIANRIEFLGFIDRAELLMKLSNVVVMPSLSEGLPNVALEAFAVGTPLVASRVGGLVDVGKLDDEAIIYCQPNDPADLADRIQQVLDDSPRTARMVRAGRRIVEGPLSTKHVARRYERLYRDIAGAGEERNADSRSR